MMKKIIIVVVLIGVLFNCLSLFADFDREVHINAITRMRIFLTFKGIGLVSGYVVFLDSDGNQCATSAVLQVVKVQKYDSYLPDISFEANDFEFMELRGGDVIYALPIVLYTNEVKTGDYIEIKCGSLKAGCRVF